MSRPNPHRRRRRPGRRPPGRYSGLPPSPPRPRGFTPPGWRQACDLVLPFRGRDKRLFFNRIGGGIAVAAGLFGALVGYAVLGLLGAFVGLWAGVTLCGMALEDGRYIRR